MTKRIAAVVIPLDPDEPIRQVEFDQGDIAYMQGIVGGNVDVIDTVVEPRTSIWINDDGRDVLPTNPRASLYLWAGDARWRGQDVLFGDVLITGTPDEEGSTTSIPDAVLALMFETVEYRVQVQTIDDRNAWSGNGIRFDDYFAALYNVLNLAERWALVTEVRVIPA